MSFSRWFLLLYCVILVKWSYAQQDISLSITKTFLSGKNIIKVKRNYTDPYVWAITDNHEVYRINSITYAVDDYTPKFTAYATQQWVDLAGAGPDHLFIALNGSLIVEYKNGTASLLNNIGIPGTVNSIGFDAIYSPDYTYTTYALAIATSNGLIYYDFNAQTTKTAPYNTLTHIYDASYRSFMYQDGTGPRFPEPTVTHQGMFEHHDYTIYGEDILLGGPYGNVISSAYYTRGSMWYGATGTFIAFSNTFYGTEVGLIQLGWYANNSTRPYGKYLVGRQINKISSVFGLGAFTNRNEFGFSLGRENLLVGTDAGLYFSNSHYMTSSNYTPPEYTFFHYADLGLNKINDIAPNSNSDQINVNRLRVVPCEDGAWIATANGLYLLHTSYRGYFDETSQIPAIVFSDNPLFGVTEKTNCGPVNTQIIVAGGFSFTPDQINWQKNGQDIPGEHGNTLTANSAGEYNAILKDCSGMQAQTNHLKITQLNGPIFTFNYPNKLSYCYNSNATLQTENNSNYAYRWYKDGVLNGNTTNMLNTNQPGKYKLEVSACSGSWIPTKEVEITFEKIPQPVITPDKAAYCAGTAAILTASIPFDATGVLNWQAYQYQWYREGVVITGATTSTLNITQPGKYTVTATACIGNSATSAVYNFAPINIAQPLITADKAAYCTGATAILNTDFVNDGNFIITWLRNGIAMPAEQNKIQINTNIAGAYTINITNKLTLCSQTSNSYILGFEPPPDISIQRVINTTLCSGQTVDLKASYSGGTISWSTGETTSIIEVKTSGTYMATVKTQAGCEITRFEEVKFNDNPTINMPDATLCQFTNEQITLTAPPGFIKYEWDGQTGAITFTTGKLGPVTLKVTDENGCTATQTIHISSHCKDIHIPNTFTPNGDGINDEWLISGLEGDKNVSVKIYNRYGGLIFISQGYAVPWNGTYNNAKVPGGTYYYVINAKGSSQVLSGSITVIY